MEESPGNTADDLSRLFADTPGKGENPVPASPRRRPGRRVLIVAACLAVPLTACGAAFFLQGDPDPGYGVSPGPAPAPRVHRKPESPAAKERAGSPAPETGKSAAEPGSLGENAKLMNELEAMRLRTRIAREEADYLKAKQAADAVRNGSGPRKAVPPLRPPPGRTEKPPVPLEGTPSFPYRAPGTACGLSRAPRKDALSPSGRAVPSPAAG